MQFIEYGKENLLSQMVEWRWKVDELIEERRQGDRLAKEYIEQQQSGYEQKHIE